MRWGKLGRASKKRIFLRAAGKGKSARAFPSPSQCPCSAALFSLFLIIGINDLNASFTEFSSGKNSATSGSMITTFVPFEYLFAYLPLIPLLKSYSSNISGSFDIRFIIIPFFFGGFSGTDNPYIIPYFSMNDNQHAIIIRHSNKNQSFFNA